MDMRHFEDATAADHAAADFIAQRLWQAIDARGGATFAMSGGSTPWHMFERLAAEDVPWVKVTLFQVDERVVPLGDEARNWSRFLQNGLASRVPKINCHAMPVETDDMNAAAAEYASILTDVAGDPPVLDVVHLGIGEDGHTASLFAGDPLLEESRQLVGVSKPYQGHHRLSLTLPVLNKARSIVWLATGAERQKVLHQLREGDVQIPAGRVSRDQAVVFSADNATL